MMATKTTTHSARYGVKVESEQIIDGVTAASGHEGTAMALAQAVEDGDAEVYAIRKDVTNPAGTDTDRIRVICEFGGDGEAQAVPAEVNDQLTEWGYVHEGENDEHSNYTHRDEVREHVYVEA